MRRGPARSPFSLGGPSPGSPQPTTVHAAPRGIRSRRAGRGRCVWAPRNRAASALLETEKRLWIRNPKGKYRFLRAPGVWWGVPDFEARAALCFQSSSPESQGQGFRFGRVRDQVRAQPGCVYCPSHRGSDDASNRRQTSDLKRDPCKISGEPATKKLIVGPALQARGKEKGPGSPSSCERAEPQAPPWPGE